ncbi:MAG: 5-oxoprolinase subunit PxpB [Coriobacteriia bacterium]|nr:5-oxoprolinase subunit PxpB [Coriobacteriia bacterium]
MSFNITLAGDSSLNVVLSSVISDDASRLVRAAADAIEAADIPGVTELVPTFCSVMICYDPLLIGYADLAQRVSEQLSQLSLGHEAARRVIEIPVCYGGDFGPDIATVMEHSGLTEEELVALHSGHDYLINMLGFLPGFAYLGGLDERLHTPRLDSPRTTIPAGSVGIGGAQTGIYPLASPGGWQLIGRTPVRPYDADRERPILYEAGDYLRFVPISKEDYVRIEAAVADGSYECRVHLEGTAEEGSCAIYEGEVR